MKNLVCRNRYIAIVISIFMMVTMFTIPASAEETIKNNDILELSNSGYHTFVDVTLDDFIIAPCSFEFDLERACAVRLNFAGSYITSQNQIRDGFVYVTISGGIFNYEESVTVPMNRHSHIVSFNEGTDLPYGHYTISFVPDYIGDKYILTGSVYSFDY